MTANENPLLKPVRVVPIGSVRQRHLDAARGALCDVFGVAAAVAPQWDPAVEAFNPLRNQWMGGVLLNSLSQAQGDPSRWTLGIVDADLYIPGLTYIFGAANVQKQSAVVGLGRLYPMGEGPTDLYISTPPPYAHAPGRSHWPEGYGPALNGEVLMRHRVEVEVVHELGHLAGLGHCLNSDCVMWRSSTIKESDFKRSTLCEKCSAQLGDSPCISGES